MTTDKTNGISYESKENYKQTILTFLLKKVYQKTITRIIEEGVFIISYEGEI